MMFDFLNKKKNKNTEEVDLMKKTASLLIHVAKIDENYTEKEKIIIKKTLLQMKVEKKNIENVFNEAELMEKNSNQILDFTREIKNTNDEFKKKLIESLWHIIFSDGSSDMYESNLMRRLTGLIYLDTKVVGDIKVKVKKNLKK